MVYNLVHNAIKFTAEGGNVQVSLEIVPFADLSVWLPEDGLVPPPKHVGDESLPELIAEAMQVAASIDAEVISLKET